MVATEIRSDDVLSTIHVKVTVGEGGVLSFSGEGVSPDGSITISGTDPDDICSIKFKLAEDGISNNYRFPRGVILDVRDGDNEYHGLDREVTIENVARRAGVAHYSVSVVSMTTGTRISQDPPIRNR